MDLKKAGCKKIGSLYLKGDGDFSWTMTSRGQSMGVQVVEFSNGVYEIRKIFALKINIRKGNY